MRTFPKSLATFRSIVSDRGSLLRELPLKELQQFSSKQPEHLIVESHHATIGTIIHLLPDGSLRVVVQGFMKARWIPGRHVAIDGFYKRPDGSVDPMPTEELYGYD